MPTEKELQGFRTSALNAAVAPIAVNPLYRNRLLELQKAAEQTIDTLSQDQVLFAGADTQTNESAQDAVRSFHDYIEQHKAEITALQILYSRPYPHRLTEPMLKELEQKLRENHAAWTEDRLWDAFTTTAPNKVKGRSQVGRFADLVSLVRFALEQQPVLEPFAESVRQRFECWLRQRDEAAAVRSLLSRRVPRRSGMYRRDQSLSLVNNSHGCTSSVTTLAPASAWSWAISTTLPSTSAVAWAKLIRFLAVISQAAR